MMPSLVGTNMAGVAHQHVSGGAYTVDTMLNELSKQLIGNTRRYSRASNGGQPRVGNAMRISKPGSASNSPRSSTLQSRRRTLIGDGFRGGLQMQSPAMDQMYMATPAPESRSESFYDGETTRPARPLSWHPSSQNAQQSLYSHQDSSNAMLYSYSTYSDAEILASLQHLPPTPAVYSGYTSPADPFSPLSLPYSSFNSSQPIYSPPSQPIPTPPPQQQQQQQHQAPVFRPGSFSNYTSASEISYLPPSNVADEFLSWDAYPSSNTLLNRHTAPPTPEDFACSLMSNQAVETGTQQQQQQQQQHQQHQQPAQPLIHDDENDDESDGEILYGMGLYDAPDHGKGLHQSVVLSLLGSARDPREEIDTGKGLGLKLEDAWEPPASEDEDDDDDDDEEEEDDDDDGEGQDD
ncbi:hypothetical protein C8A00DRAFT_43915 [Chaetomidium leptoderma]|uniref:Uncharacterized protein n=1 Tax=Chaetomidium leptoderma TaxID=669021 RepID=A0AAN6VMW8_9PEZI|nr:hypothetical protein C8A00DRAFT_43915 [Chaetomidium leptoderma]